MSDGTVLESWTETSADGSVQAKTELTLHIYPGQSYGHCLQYRVAILQPWASLATCVGCSGPDDEDRHKKDIEKLIAQSHEATRRVVGVAAAAHVTDIHEIWGSLWRAIYEGFEMPHPALQAEHLA